MIKVGPKAYMFQADMEQKCPQCKRITDIGTQKGIKYVELIMKENEVVGMMLTCPGCGHKFRIRELYDMN